MPPKDTRIESMDSVRGLAALQVVICHALLMAPAFWEVTRTKRPAGESPLVNLFTFSPLRTFWAGHEAVILFFVMSGFVLSIPFFERDNVSYKAFFIKRVFRIYGPYLCTLLIGGIACAIFIHVDRVEDLSEWFNDIWRLPLTRQDWFSYVSLQPGKFHKIVTSLWTLPIEIKVSLVLPLFIWWLKRLNFIYCLLLPLGNVAFYMVGKRAGFANAFPDFSLFYYLTFFLSGSVICKYRRSVLNYVDKIGTFWVVLACLGCILLYTFESTIKLLPGNFQKTLGVIPGDYLVCLASLGLIVFSISKRSPRWLSTKYLVLLGKVSFSLYLIHPIIIGIIGFTMGGHLPVYALIMLAIVLSLLVAVPFCRFIELPFQNLGRKLSKKYSS